MSRPREYDGRTSTSVRFPAELHAELTKAAEDRDVSVNWLVNRAVHDFLARLIPADEIVWTRDKAPPVTEVRKPPPMYTA